jgi:hypothetical protein
MQEDKVHVLTAIVESLGDHFQWPDENRQQELGRIFPQILRQCIGIGDVKDI